jgi:hypothetical protein
VEKRIAERLEELRRLKARKRGEQRVDVPPTSVPAGSGVETARRACRCILNLRGQAIAPTIHA